MISVDVVHPDMLSEGWTFETPTPARPAIPSTAQRLYEIYLKAKPDYPAA